MATTYIKTLQVGKIQQDQAFVDPVTGKPTQLTVRTINDNNSNIAAIVNALAQQVADQQAILDRLVTAEDNIDQANKTITSNARQQKLVNSYTDPAAILTAVTNADGTSAITIIDHKRIYADAAKTTVNVTGGTVTQQTTTATAADGTPTVVTGPLQASSGYVVFYNDTLQTGGTVTYKASANGNDALQTGAVHSVGYVTTPAVGGGSSGGGGGGGPGTGPRCIWEEAMLHSYVQGKDLEVGDEAMILDYDNDHFVFGSVEALGRSRELCVTIVTESGIELTVSTTTPVRVWTGETINVLHTLGHEVATMDDGIFAWEEVVDLRIVGVLPVTQVDVGDKNYAAGDERDRLIFTHNKPVTEEQPDLE